MTARLLPNSFKELIQVFESVNLAQKMTSLDGMKVSKLIENLDDADQQEVEDMLRDEYGDSIDSILGYVLRTNFKEIPNVYRIIHDEVAYLLEGMGKTNIETPYSDRYKLKSRGEDTAKILKEYTAFMDEFKTVEDGRFNNYFGLMKLSTYTRFYLKRMGTLGKKPVQELYDKLFALVQEHTYPDDRIYSQLQNSNSLFDISSMFESIGPAVNVAPVFNTNPARKIVIQYFFLNFLSFWEAQCNEDRNRSGTSIIEKMVEKELKWGTTMSRAFWQEDALPNLDLKIQFENTKTGSTITDVKPFNSVYEVQKFLQSDDGKDIGRLGIQFTEKGADANIESKSMTTKMLDNLKSAYGGTFGGASMAALISAFIYVAGAIALQAYVDPYLALPDSNKQKRSEFYTKATLQFLMFTISTGVAHLFIPVIIRNSIRFISPFINDYWRNNFRKASVLSIGVGCVGTSLSIAATALKEDRYLLLSVGMSVTQLLATGYILNKGKKKSIFKSTAKEAKKAKTGDSVWALVTSQAAREEAFTNNVVGEIIGINIVMASINWHFFAGRGGNDDFYKNQGLNTYGRVFGASYKGTESLRSVDPILHIYRGLFTNVAAILKYGLRSGSNPAPATGDTCTNWFSPCDTEFVGAGAERIGTGFNSKKSKMQRDAEINLKRGVPIDLVTFALQENIAYEINKEENKAELVQQINEEVSKIPGMF